MVSIYGPETSNRIAYVLDYVFLHRLNTPYVYITDYQLLKQDKNPCIEYSQTSTRPDALHIPQANLLVESSVYKLNPLISKSNPSSEIDIIKLFPASDSASPIDFDIFSAIFYMITRYEEYTHESSDILGRMEGKSSFANRHACSDRPIVDEWIELIKNSLTSKLGIPLIDQKPTYKVELTVDVDRAYAYNNRPIIDNILGGTKHLIQGKMTAAKRRVASLSKSANDPYDTYEMLIDRYGPNILWFFLLQNKKPYDTAIGLNNGSLRDLIQRISATHTVGIHPSVSSHNNISAIKKESDLLASFTHQKVSRSRQHYLNLRLPETYRSLIQAGIKHDYSMGYHDIIGFRAGTCFPFLWYDLRAEQVTDLTIHPFQIMDVTLKKYLGLTPNEAIDECNTVIQSIQKVNGTCSVIWHNSSFYTEEGWKDWDRVLDHIVQSND